MHDGEEAGIKSATILVKGHNAYGWLKTESGVHRLVRISPYDPQRAPPHLVRIDLGLSGRRRLDRHRDQRERTAASTPIAPRVRAASTSTRPIRPCASPISRPASWWRASRSARSTRTGPRPGRCCARALRGRTEEARGSGQCRSRVKTDIGWGHQIRSYVLQPYQLVKDLRTGVESTDAVGRVLDGDLNAFMEAALAHRISGKADAVTDDLTRKNISPRAVQAVKFLGRGRLSFPHGIE